MYNTDIPTRAELPTPGQLVRSTLIAIVAAAAILVTIVLPAEYGIDPTGIGRVLRLTQMGEIKVQLAEEAALDRARDRQAPTSAPPTERKSSFVNRLFAELAIGSAAAQTAGKRSDETVIDLRLNEGVEYKLTMKKGAKVNFSWQTDGVGVNYDMHGTPGAGGKETSYKMGRGAKNDSGVLEAQFDGQHGWFWRNRTANIVTIILKTNGEYSEIKRMN